MRLLSGKAGVNVDNLTHTLTAIAISHTGLNRKTRLATLTVILGANAPDIDLLARLKDSGTYLEYHRGLTHSLLGIVLLAIILSGIMYLVGQKIRPKPDLPLNGRWLALAAFLGTASHLLLDFTNSYGVRPFLPFSGRWYAGDITFIFDPLLLVLLVLGLGVPWLLRLVSEEVGARKPRLMRGAIFSFCAMTLLWGIRDFAHRRALSILDSRTYSNQNPRRLGAFPSPGNPFAWTGVVETETSFLVLQVNALDPNNPPEIIRTFNKPERSPALEAAMETRTGRIFTGFARFPWGKVEESDEGFLVSFRDLRFYRGSAQSRNFLAQIELDRKLRPRSESFHFSAPRRPGED
jgi:inner membrane protein